MLFFLHQGLAIEKKMLAEFNSVFSDCCMFLLYPGLISSLLTSSLSLDYTLNNRVQALESNCMI